MHIFHKLLLSAAISVAPISALADTNVTNVAASLSDTDLGATSTMTVTFTTEATLSVDDHITTTITDGSSFATVLDFSALTVSGGTALPYISGSDIFENGQPAGPEGPTLDGVSSRIGSELPAGTYTLEFSGIINPNTPATIAVAISTFESLDPNDYTASNSIVIEEFVPEPVFATTPLLNLKAREVKKFSALLKWDAYTGEEDVFYKVKLMNKKGKDLKTFKSVQSNMKQIKKSTGLLKPGKTYKFKVRACQVEDPTVCTDWSANKKFVTKAAE